MVLRLEEGVTSRGIRVVFGVASGFRVLYFMSKGSGFRSEERSFLYRGFVGVFVVEMFDVFRGCSRFVWGIVLGRGNLYSLRFFNYSVDCFFFGFCRLK